MKRLGRPAVRRAGVLVAAALFATLAGPARAELCVDFAEQIARVESLKESTRHPDYINAARTLAATREAAIESMQSQFQAVDLAAIVASGKSATSAIGNRNASDSFLEAALIVFQAIRFEIDSGRFMQDERGKILVEMIAVAGGMGKDALDAANTAQHDAGIAFHRTLYAIICG